MKSKHKLWSARAVLVVVAVGGSGLLSQAHQDWGLLITGIFVINAIAWLGREIERLRVAAVLDRGAA